MRGLNSQPLNEVSGMDILSYLMGKQAGGGRIPSGYIKPTGTIDITENGEYDVAQYASANIDVSGGGDTSAETGIIDRTLSGTYTNSTVSMIGTYAFAYCDKLTAVNFPNAKNVAGDAFYSCSKLTSANMPNATTIGASAFYNCKELIDVNFPNATTLFRGAFQACTSLTEAYFPNVVTVDNAVFNNCSKLTIVSLPKAAGIGSSAFGYCSLLTTATFPMATNIGSYAFYNCSSLTTANLPMIKNIGSNAFYNCSRLASVYMTGSTVATLQTNVFNNTPMSISTYLGHFGSFFVKESLLADWQAANNWSVYSERFVGLTDAEIAELDGQ